MFALMIQRGIGDGSTKIGKIHHKARLAAQAVQSAERRVAAVPNAPKWLFFAIKIFLRCDLVRFGANGC
jgi:hypothetical protein